MVGPKAGGRKLAERISTRIADLRGCPRQWAAPTKDIIDDQKVMIFSDHDRRVENGEVVLVCDDTLTTGESIRLTTVAAAQMGGCVLPFSPVITRRLGVAMLTGNSIVSLVQMPHQVWTAQGCPLCRVGSVALRPKQSENWEMLNAPY